ncbi:A/G-specific adenine glycosylase [Phenylobacterium sp.]|uniref:A/G-specific adenine glycosylase n=1 Tax=Phenylobacterium sp. TaxID=1871053 RepID=UPI002732296E|nr:A/G-specific adenine glycosylase [Phenylobacterium sp.]MDP1617671.1 A/G-specific adenine glycosylase [Phenylobacterium sp.]MDP1985894.1 A/G-specific adenine glycosylase [Phenylobacterium sp.]
MKPEALRAALLSWYDGHARDLPWRTGPAQGRGGLRSDPYRVWLSEVMLQQTTVPHATPYFLKFTARWPTVSDLAAAPDDEVMAAWAGLGYYARARNLLACARAVANDHGGVFPDTEAALRALPGLGPYTAAAVAAIAFDEATNVVDGNVERVMARLFAVETPLPAAKPELKSLAAALVRDERPGDWAQALMDLGATVCRPKSPLCDRCPLTAACAGLATGAPETYPRKSAKAARPHRHGVAYILTRGEEVALVRRPPKGLLGGMLALPTSDWREARWSDAEALAAAPAAGDWQGAGEVDHVFTHFSLTLRLLRAEGDADDVIWTHRRDLDALPSVFLKAARAGLSNLL